jgi:hypothetical protein
MYYYNNDNPFDFRRNPKEAIASTLLVVIGIPAFMAMLLLL